MVTHPTNALRNYFICSVDRGDATLIASTIYPQHYRHEGLIGERGPRWAEDVKCQAIL